MKELVIDVSHCDPDIDIAEWKRRRGIWAVIVKCGGYEVLKRGCLPEQFQTRVFERHYQQVVANGLHVGAYYYSVATDVETARANADHCASILAGHHFDMPIYLDIEDANQLSIGKRALTDVILAFIGRMREHGYDAGTYTYRSMLHASMYGSELEPYPLWVAEYSDRCRTDLDYGMWQFGAIDIDGHVTWDDEDGYVDANWCYVDYPSRGGNMKRVYLNNEAAEIHYFMVTDPRFGYSQHPERWGGEEEVEFTSSSGRKYRLQTGAFDCSSSTCKAWQLVLEGTPYEGALDGASCTSDMEEAFVSSGLFYSEYSAARRGDLYLNPGDHVAMCQDGGADGVFGFDSLSEFNVNENGTATWGEPGDQTGFESVFRDYYDRPWQIVLHYNHKGDYDLDPEPPRHVVPDLGHGAVYRLYNPHNGRHHYTTGHNEAQSLCDIGWTDEGLAWRASDNGDKVRRMYNPYEGQHLLTASDTEAIELVGLGWQYEGVAMYSKGSTEVYRLFNAHSREHLWTTSIKERDALRRAGWKSEGIGLWAVSDK